MTAAEGAIQAMQGEAAWDAAAYPPGCSPSATAFGRRRHEE